MKNMIKSIFLLVVAVSVFSCKSTPKLATYDVNPIDLLDSGATFYVSMDPETDVGLASRILQKYFEGSERQTKQLLSKISTVYAGFYNSRKSSSVRLAARANFPASTERFAFTKKNGFTENIFPAVANVAGQEIQIDYKYYTNDSLATMQVSLPSTSVACLSPDVVPMLERYNALSYGNESDGGPQLAAEMHGWLKEPGKQIRFYAENPTSFLTILTGANLNLQLKYVRATLDVDYENSENYNLGIEFEFTDERVVTAGYALLRLAFGLANSSVTRKSPTNIVVTDVNIPKEQIYSLLTL